jgi:hypothetical protein
MRPRDPRGQFFDLGFGNEGVTFFGDKDGGYIHCLGPHPVEIGGE